MELKVVNLEISSICNTFYRTIDAFIVENLNVTPYIVDITSLKRVHAHLQIIYYPSLQDSKFSRN